MAKSRREQIIDSLVPIITIGLPGSTVKRDGDTPERTGPDGLVVIRDGDPGTPEVTIGRGAYFHTQQIHVEVYAQTNEIRDSLMQSIEAAIRADETLGGLAAVSEVRLAPEDALQTQVSEGAAAIRAALLYIEVCFQSSTALT